MKDKIGNLFLELHKDRIKLAEAMMWDNIIDGNDGQPWGIDPKAPPFDGSIQYMPHGHLPDPETDANDCNALIKHLNGLGHKVMVELFPKCTLGKPPSVQVRLTLAGRGGSEYWSGENWMHGVCELALKVIE